MATSTLSVLLIAMVATLAGCATNKQWAVSGGEKQEGLVRPLEFETVSVDALRDSGRYEILTPQQCRARHRERDDKFMATLHPLVGGVPLERAWQCLNLHVEEVLGALKP